MRPTEDRRSLPAIKVRQWIDEWEKIDWNPDEQRTEPPHWFYQFSIPAKDLRALSGVYRRTTKRTSAADDPGIQRRHEVERSKEIGRFVQYGYPWSNLSPAKRESSEFNDLRQPGWLPTAIVVNVLTPGTERNGKPIHADDLIEIQAVDAYSSVLLPHGFGNHDWRHHSIPPIEVIDGQHRLWAFEDEPLPGDFEVPVVAFVGLALSWQAYLFYTINIKPKKINPSMRKLRCSGFRGPLSERVIRRRAGGAWTPSLEGESEPRRPGQRHVRGCWRPNQEQPRPLAAARPYVQDLPIPLRSRGVNCLEVTAARSLLRRS